MLLNASSSIVTMKHTSLSFRLRRKLYAFLQEETAGGMLTILGALLAIVIANSPASPFYFSLTKPLALIVNDGLMVLFFFAVGLELKRETAEGMLSTRAQMLLPLFAAIGGMALPALIYVALNHHDATLLQGWAIPSATDIAFALAALSIAGGKTSPAAKVLLLAIAIFDDVGAIAVIALFYSSKLALLPLLAAFLCLCGLLLLNRNNVANLWPYVLLGMVLVLCLHEGGIHTTLAGVATGLAVPVKLGAKEPRPLDRCLHIVHPWVTFLVLPVFAFTTAGVDMRLLSLGDMTHSLPLGVALGLILGKPIGILAAISLYTRSTKTSLPENLPKKEVVAISMLAGIGFTMSLFISLLAFPQPHWQEMAKIGILSGSLISALLGIAVLRAK